LASGKKNYFRHHFNASKDPKVVALIDDFGKEAYFHYFRLLELCASIASDEFPEDHKFTFRRSTVCQELRVTNSRLTHHLLAIQSSLLGEVLVTQKEVQILFPKLSKYMGKYETKLPSNTPNKRKEKKRKENKIKDTSDPISSDEVLNGEIITSEKTSEKEMCDDVAELWNEMASLNALPKVKLPLSRDRIKKMKPALVEFKEYSDWLRIVNGVIDNDFNLGVNDRKWKANFDWLFHTTKFNYRKLWETHAEENI
jgi:hypothetical protein